MSSTDRQMELQVALLDGELSPEDAAELEAILQSDPALLAELASSVAIDRLLGLAAEPAPEAEAFSREVVARLELPTQKETFARTVKDRLKPRRPVWTRLALPLAASLAVFAGLGWWLTRDHALARVHATADLTWTAGPGPAIGSAIEKDSSLSIDSGLLELSLAGRGQLALEGPARLTVHGRKNFTLHQGRAVFTVTPRGHGLTVHTPHGTVVDLGTSFALDVTASASELHVLEGTVSFQPVAGPKSIVSAAEAMVADADEATTIAPEPDRFVRSVPAPQRSGQPDHYWHCDENHGRRAATADPALGFELRSATADGDGPNWTDGPGSPALSFDGKGAYAQSAFRGIEGSSPRTVALWVRVPRDWTPLDGGALVSWGRFEWKEPGVMFELTLNRDRALGPLGAPQLDTFGHRVTAEGDLRDGKWHHLAVTTHQDPGNASRTHVLFYLDGHLLPSFPRSVPRIDTLASGGRHGVLLGRSVQSINVPTPPTESFLRGDLDGIYISSDVLDTSGLRQLAEGRPPRGR